MRTPTWLALQSKKTEKKAQREKKTAICRDPLEPLAEYSSVHMCEEISNDGARMKGKK